MSRNFGGLRICFLRTKRSRSAAEFAEACHFKLAADKERQMSCHHGAKAEPACSVRVRGIEADEIAVVDELATGLAAGVEACVAAGALALQSQ
jgi:hypothetical protein